MQYASHACGLNPSHLTGDGVGYPHTHTHTQTFSALSIPVPNRLLNHCSEYWYMGSTAARLEAQKKRVEARKATGRYLLRISSMVASVTFCSATFVLISRDVSRDCSRASIRSSCSRMSYSHAAKGEGTLRTLVDRHDGQTGGSSGGGFATYTDKEKVSVLQYEGCVGRGGGDNPHPPGRPGYGQPLSP